MADNYLERKMEEHRAGRDTTPAARRSTGTPALAPGMPRRIAIIATGRQHLNAIIAPLRHPHIRLAVLNTIPADATDLGTDHGIRYYTISENGHDTTLADALTALHRAWLGLDLIVIADRIDRTAAAVSTWMPTRIPDGTAPLPAILLAPNILRRHTITGPYTVHADAPYHPLPDRETCPEATHIPYLAAHPDITTIHL